MPVTKNILMNLTPSDTSDVPRLDCKPGSLEVQKAWHTAGPGKAREFCLILMEGEEGKEVAKLCDRQGSIK